MSISIVRYYLHLFFPIIIPTVRSAKMMITKDMLLLSVAFAYTGRQLPKTSICDAF